MQVKCTVCWYPFLVRSGGSVREIAGFSRSPLFPQAKALIAPGWRRFSQKAPTQRKSHTPNQKSWTTPQASVGRPHGASSLHAASKPVPRAWNVSDPPAAGGQAQCLHQGHKGRRSVPPNPYAGMALQAATAPDPHGHASFAMVSAASIERLKACAAWPRRTRSEGSKTNSCSRSSSNSRASG